MKKIIGGKTSTEERTPNVSMDYYLYKGSFSEEIKVVPYHQDDAFFFFFLKYFLGAIIGKVTFSSSC